MRHISNLYCVLLPVLTSTRVQAYLSPILLTWSQSNLAGILINQGISSPPVMILCVDCGYVFLFTSCFTISSLHCLSSLCMTPEDDMWSSITWLTVWATCQQHVSTHVSRLSNYCTITLCLHTDLTAMSAHAWEASWYVFESDHRLHNGPTQTRTIWYSHHLAITVLLFTYSYFY